MLNNETRAAGYTTTASDVPVTAAHSQSAGTASPAAPPGGIGGAVRQTLGWIAGMAIVFCAGWGFLYLVWHLIKKLKLAAPGDDTRLIILGIAAAVSLAIFVLLERKFWLSRLSGLRVSPGASPLRSAAYYWLLGVPGMFMTAGSEAQKTAQADTPRHQPGHAPREAIETIVFVVVLVFLLKQFVVEAFVIPTGSMAETLYGYQKTIVCPQCDFEFPLNSSVEVDPQPGIPKRPVKGFCCPNCRFKQAFDADHPPPYNASGDRVLVHKAMQHIHTARPGDVVVFKFPTDPQRYYSAQNYIKRMWGVGGDTIAIWRGDLFVCKTLTFPPLADARPEDLWQRHYAFPLHENAMQKFESSRVAGFPVGVGGFELIRKSDELLLAMRRIVYDNQHQSRYLISRGVPPRWKAMTSDWSADNAAAAKVFTHTGTELGWLRYRHLAYSDTRVLAGPKTPAIAPVPVDNFLGYNAEVTSSGEFENDRGAEDYRFWVGDLTLDCRVKVTDPASEVVLELSKGPNRFQAKFVGGKVTLIRTGPGGSELGTWPTPMTGPGTYDLRFANVDCRLRVWVDEEAVPLGPEADYSPTTPDVFEPEDARKEGWTKANDVEAPASVGATGAVEISQLKLWRDTFFINSHYSHTDNATTTVHTYYVQPGHYLCLGDNSAQSSDGREWGTVPERLMLGRAVFVFFPIDRVGFIK